MQKSPPHRFKAERASGNVQGELDHMKPMITASCYSTQSISTRWPVVEDSLMEVCCQGISCYRAASSFEAPSSPFPSGPSQEYSRRSDPGSYAYRLDKRLCSQETAPLLHDLACIGATPLHTSREEDRQAELKMPLRGL